MNKYELTTHLSPIVYSIDELNSTVNSLIGRVSDLEAEVEELQKKSLNYDALESEVNFLKAWRDVWSPVIKERHGVK